MQFIHSKTTNWMAYPTVKRNKIHLSTRWYHKLKMFMCQQSTHNFYMHHIEYHATNHDYFIW